MRRRRLLTNSNVSHVLALDLSLNRPGAAVLAVSPVAISIEHVEHLRVNTKRNHGERLAQIRDWIRGLHERYPNVERVYAKEDAPPSAVTGATLNRVHGVVQEALAPLDYRDISQGTVKKIVVGRGGSDVTKGDVEDAVRAVLALPESYRFAVDDEADACAVGLAYLALEQRLPTDERFDALRLRAAESGRKKTTNKRKVAKTAC